MVLDTQERINYRIPAAPDKGVFRAYDIRGIVGAAFNDDVVYAVGRALGNQAHEQGVKKFALGRDARESSPGFAKAMAQGLLDSGIDVVDIGIVPSPVLYFATHHLDTNSGVMITGSHNPSDYNGIKMVLNGTTLSDGGIAKIYQDIIAGQFVDGAGSYSEQNILSAYMQTILDRVKLARPLKVVIDCGNGVGGLTAPHLFKSLGCEVTELYCDVDGRFPNHHPDPTVPKNMVDLIAEVKKQGADCGFGFDGDADRMGFVTNDGELIWPDRYMMVLAKDVLSRNPGADIVYDVKSTNHLADAITQAGGNPVMYKTGHSILKAKMVELGSPLAGEMSGHVFFKDGWFGFDDGVYAGIRLLACLANESCSAAELFAQLPNNLNTPELKLEIADDKKHAFVKRLLAEGQFPGAKLIDIDGIRLEYPDAWGLVRASNTTPCLTIRFEALDESGLNKVKRAVGEEILRLDPSLQLPFDYE